MAAIYIDRSQNKLELLKKKLKKKICFCFENRKKHKQVIHILIISISFFFAILANRVSKVSKISKKFSNL